MLGLAAGLRVYLAVDPVDLRKGFDGLAGLAIHVLKQDPLSGHLLVFVNRRKNRMKILLFERTGYWLFYKRLEAGRFHLPHVEGSTRGVEINSGDLAMILEGVDLCSAKRHKRFTLPKISA